MKIRDAGNNDHAAVAAVAEHSELLTGELTRDAFPGMLAWLYAGAPASVRLQFVAEHDERIVAHYGAVPIAYKLFEERCLAGFASNLVIHKEHRAGMLFLSLQTHLQREARRLGFRFLYGLITRANVLEPHLRMGWRRIGAAPVYAKPLNFPAVAAAVIEHPVLRALTFVPLKVLEAVWRLRWRWGARARGVEEVAAFGPDADAFLAAFTAGRAICAVRSCEILNWRFGPAAERGYRIFVARRGGAVAGYAVTRLMRLKELRALVVVDLAFDPADGDAGDALLQRCDAVALEAKVDVAATLMNPNSPYLRRLRRFGYLKTPESFTLVAWAPKDAPQPQWDAGLFADWHLSWFDHDFV